MMLNKLISCIPYLSGFRVLMYHRVDSIHSDFLTVTAQKLEQQITFLKSEGFQFIKLSKLHEFMDENKSPPKNDILLTFDDAYLNNLEHLLPILKKHSIHAALFIPVGYIGKKNEWDGGQDQIMSYEQLKKMEECVEFGLHSFSHSSYSVLSLSEIEEDIRHCQTELQKNGIKYEPSLAYPFGSFPRGKTKLELDQILKKTGIKSAFRIGNKLNKKINPYEINRIDIRGNESFNVFQLKVKLGKIKI